MTKNMNGTTSRSARRFLWRWNARVLVKDRRQYRAIFLLISTAAALSVAGVLAAYHLVEPPENTYGNGEVIASAVGDSALVEQALTDQGHSFGVIRSIRLPVEGSARRVPIRQQDPENGVTEPLLALTAGRWPSAAD